MSTTRQAAGEPDPYGRPTRDWRREVANASGLVGLVGIWLIISPWVLNFTSGDGRWSPIASGAAVLVLASARVAGLHRETWLSLINAGIGAWLFASAFWLTESHRASWGVGVSGAVVFALAFWSAGASGERDQDPVNSPVRRHR